MATTSETDPATQTGMARLRAPSLVLGVGFGGFFDGIVLHQVLQWHHMLSNTGDDRLGLPRYPVTTVAGLEVNTLWDGLFHVACYLFALAGVIWLWERYRTVRPARPPLRLLLGGLLAGWGIFNLVEGVIDHHLLAIHHVYDTGDPGLTLLYDLLFLAVGAVLLGAGTWLQRTAVRRARER